MKKRLITIFIAITLASVILVGAGVLVMARLGAKSDAETKLVNQLDSITELVATSPQDTRSLIDLSNTRRRLDFSSLEIVTIEEDGNVIPIAAGPRNRRNVTSRAPQFSLTSDEVAAASTQETLLLSDGRDGRFASNEVAGIRLLSPPDSSTQRALFGTQPFNKTSSQAFLWFALSSLAVLAVSVVAAVAIANKLTKPLHKIHAATTALAQGNLATRVEVSGAPEIKQVGVSVNQMAQNLQDSKNLDRQFLLSVSHDLRTPLTVIEGYAEALAEEATPDPKNAGVIISSHAKRLERLVDDLLDLARIDANQFTLSTESVDISALVQRILAGLQHKAAEADVTIETTLTDQIRLSTDSDRCAQILTNLVENALKFAKTRLAVTVRQEGGAVTIEVADDGPGIDPQELPHIFDRFYMARKRPERAEKPLGLGLFISKELAVALGGDLQVRSTVGTGATMIFSLPLSS